MTHGEVTVRVCDEREKKRGLLAAVTNLQMQPAGKDTKEGNKRVVRDGTGRDGTYLARLRRAL